jgi:hypothetical protein
VIRNQRIRATSTSSLLRDDIKPGGDPLFVEKVSNRPAVKQAWTELGSLLDAGKLTAWFQEPNLWLGSRRPLDRLDKSPDYVLDAARADLCVARG